MSVNDFWQLASFLVAAGAVYGGIRGDLKAMHARQDRIEHEQERFERALEKAHERIDECVSCPGRRHGDR